MFCPLWVLKSLRYTTVNSPRQEGYFQGHSQASPRQAHGKKFFAATHITSQINSTTVERKQTHTLCFHGKASDIICLFFFSWSFWSSPRFSCFTANHIISYRHKYILIFFTRPFPFLHQLTCLAAISPQPHTFSRAAAGGRSSPSLCPPWDRAYRGPRSGWGKQRTAQPRLPTLQHLLLPRPAPLIDLFSAAMAGIGFSWPGSLSCHQYQFATCTLQGGSGAQRRCLIEKSYCQARTASRCWHARPSQHFII